MHSKPKILIVGDTNEQGTIRSDYLATFGYSTGSASTGAEALQQIRAEALDLVIIEEPLPDTSCHELCEQIRRLSGRNLPAIVLITKSKHLPTQKNGERLEADDILVKPIHTSQLITRIGALLKTREVVRELHEQAAQLKDRNAALETHLKQNVRIADMPRILNDLGDHFKKEGAMVFNVAYLLKSALEVASGGGSEINQENYPGRGDRNLISQSLQVLKQSAENIQHAAKSMRDFGQALVIPPQFKKCQLAKLVGSLLTRIDIIAQEKGILLKAKELDGLPAIEADEGQLAEALYYLTLKVFSDLSPGSTLILRGEVLAEEKVIRVFVDGSSGMPSSDSLGYMVDGPGWSRRSDVAGLGSIISRQLVESHGGSVKSTIKQPDAMVQGGSSPFKVMGSPYSSVCICLPIDPTKFSPVCAHCPKEAKQQCFSTREGTGDTYVSPLSLTPSVN